jgi:hypothetical protein
MQVVIWVLMNATKPVLSRYKFGFALMRSLIGLIFLAEFSFAFSQVSKSYVIKLNGDTVPVKVIRIDKKMKGVFCEAGTRKIKYAAGDILALKYDSLLYEPAKIRTRKLRARPYLLLRAY